MSDVDHTTERRRAIEVAPPYGIPADKPVGAVYLKWCLLEMEYDRLKGSPQGIITNLSAE